jgi:hypothetical protein
MNIGPFVERPSGVFKIQTAEASSAVAQPATQLERSQRRLAGAPLAVGKQDTSSSGMGARQGQ